MIFVLIMGFSGMHGMRRGAQAASRAGQAAYRSIPRATRGLRTMPRALRPTVRPTQPIRGRQVRNYQRVPRPRIESLRPMQVRGFSTESLQEGVEDGPKMNPHWADVTAEDHYRDDPDFVVSRIHEQQVRDINGKLKRSIDRIEDNSKAVKDIAILKSLADHASDLYFNRNGEIEIQRRFLNILSEYVSDLENPGTLIFVHPKNFTALNVIPEIRNYNILKDVGGRIVDIINMDINDIPIEDIQTILSKGNNDQAKVESFNLLARSIPELKKDLEVVKGLSVPYEVFFMNIDFSDLQGNLKKVVKERSWYNPARYWYGKYYQPRSKPFEPQRSTSRRWYYNPMRLWDRIRGRQ